MKQVHLTQRELDSILRLSKGGMSTRVIAQAFGVSSACVSYWVRKKARRAPPPSPPPRKQTSDRRRKIVQQLACKQRFVWDECGGLSRKVPLHGSARAIATALARDYSIDVSRQTVHRDLVALGFVSRVRPKTTSTSLKDAVTRVVFSKKLLCKRKEWFKRVCFSDEKIFTSNDATWRRMWVRRGCRPLPRERRRWPKGRVHVWGCVGIGFRHLVVFPESKANDNRAQYRLTKQQYVRRCLSPVIPFLLDGNAVFQQDGAGAHVSGEAFVECKGVEFLKNWPPRSPQLNPIETLWAILQERVAQHHPRNREELVQTVRAEWDAVSSKTVDALVLSFSKRLKSCIAEKGFS